MRSAGGVAQLHNDDVTELVGVRLILIKRQLRRPFVGFSSPDKNQ